MLATMLSAPRSLAHVILTIAVWGDYKCYHSGYTGGKGRPTEVKELVVSPLAVTRTNVNSESLAPGAVLLTKRWSLSEFSTA